MPDYRAVVRHVGYWRGQIHRWSTSYSFTGSGSPLTTAAAQTLLTADDNMCYGTATANGGTYQCEIYLASGGTPVATYTKFAYGTTGSWPGFASLGWPSRTAVQEPVREAALLVTWPAGFSSTGKPVEFKKWYHAVPDTTLAASTAPDVSPTAVTQLTTFAQTLASCLAPTYGLVLGNSRRLAGFTPTVHPFYSSHQMPKGRRRKPLVTASGRYTGPTVQVGPIED